MDNQEKATFEKRKLPHAPNTDYAPPKEVAGILNVFKHKVEI